MFEQLLSMPKLIIKKAPKCRLSAAMPTTRAHSSRYALLCNHVRNIECRKFVVGKDGGLSMMYLAAYLCFR